MRGHQLWRTNRARTLRANGTSAEDVLWEKLRARRLGDFKFIRQAPIEKYFVDFLCRKAKLVVEVDGATHGTDIEIAADNVRGDNLNQLGYRLMRVSNSDVFENLAGVCETVLAGLETEVVQSNEES